MSSYTMMVSHRLLRRLRARARSEKVAATASARELAGEGRPPDVTPSVDGDKGGADVDTGKMHHDARSGMYTAMTAWTTGRHGNRDAWNKSIGKFWTDFTYRRPLRMRTFNHRNQRIILPKAQHGQPVNPNQKEDGQQWTAEQKRELDMPGMWQLRFFLLNPISGHSVGFT